MKTINYYLGLSTAVLVGILVYCCKTGTPGDAVKTAMEKEIIKEKAEVYIEEHNVPAVVVEEFIKNRSDTIKREWLVYQEKAGEEIKVGLPEVYIVAFSKNAQDYKAKYSKEGDFIDLNHLTNISVLPESALDVLKKGEYKDWEVVGDVFEILDNISNEPTGFIVNIQKAEQKERLFFNLEGNIVKIQKISQ